MADPEIIVPVAFFAAITISVVGLPLVRALGRKWDAQSKQQSLPPEVGNRLERIEQAIDAMSIEVERISEGQRFATKVLAERSQAQIGAPAGSDR